MKAIVYPGNDGWRWHVKDFNNEILASGRPYVRRRDAEDVVRTLFGARASFEVVIQGHSGDVVEHYWLYELREPEEDPLPWTGDVKEEED